MDVAYAFRTLLRAPAVCFRPFPIGTLTDVGESRETARELFQELPVWALFLQLFHDVRL